MITRRLAALFVSGLAAASLAACASAPAGPPEEVAQEILVAVAAADDDRADDLFDDVADEDQDDMYPVLYDAAKNRYEQGDAAGAAAILEFMAENYPEADAVRKALVYALFMERGQAAAADPELLDRMDRALAGLRSQSASVPQWADLVETQQAIDRGNADDARVSFARFLDGWDGEPAELWTYVEDVERWLGTHGS